VSGKIFLTLDAYLVDLKGFSGQTYRHITPVMDFRDILDLIKRAKANWETFARIAVRS